MSNPSSQNSANQMDDGPALRAAQRDIGRDEEQQRLANEKNHHHHKHHDLPELNKDYKNVDNVQK